MSPWPKVPLGDVLTERQEKPSDEAIARGQVKIISKIGFNDGVIQVRAHNRTKTDMILIRPGDLVISGINAAKGAIAIYDKDAKDPVAATIHYGAYIPDRDRVDVIYLWQLLRSRAFRELLKQHLPGGIKTELKAKRLLPISVPLPPLDEQRRIVARLDEVAARIDEAQRLRRQATDEAQALVISLHVELAGKRTRRLGDILKLDEHKVPVLFTESYPQVGVWSFGGGLFAKSATLGTQTTYKTFNRLYDGAVVLSQVKGWEGAVAVCTSDFQGWFVSPEYRTFRCIPHEARPHYLSALVRTEWFWERLTHATRGVGARRERTRPDQFLDLELTMPTVEQQRKGEVVFAKVDALISVQAEVSTELDSMLSSTLDEVFEKKGE